MGCWNTIVVNDLPVWEEGWQKAQADLRRRSAFELPCTEPAIQLTLLETVPYSTPPRPSSIGVTGCGKRLTYVVRDSGWIQNAKTDLEGKPPASPGTP